MWLKDAKVTSNGDLLLSRFMITTDLDKVLPAAGTVIVECGIGRTFRTEQVMVEARDNLSVSLKQEKQF